MKKEVSASTSHRRPMVDRSSFPVVWSLPSAGERKGSVSVALDGRVSCACVHKRCTMGVFVMMTRAGVRTEARKIENGAHGPNAHEGYRPSADQVADTSDSTECSRARRSAESRAACSHVGTGCELLDELKTQLSAVMAVEVFLG